MPATSSRLSSQSACAAADRALARVPGTSLHRQLFLVLRDQIVSGALAPQAPLPKEEDLCRQFGVSRITVRRALADLAAQGLVLRRHGLGTFVREGVQAPRQGPTLGLLDGLRKVATETDVRVLDLQTAVPPPAIAALLQIPPGEAAVHALRLRSAGDTPLMLTDAWIPARLGKRVTRAALEKKAMYEILMAQGVRFGRVVQEIGAETASPEHAQLLRTETGAPLLRMARLLHDRDASPVQYLTVRLVPERSRILMDVPGEAINTLTAGHVVHDAAIVPAAGIPRRRQKE